MQNYDVHLHVHTPTHKHTHRKEKKTRHTKVIVIVMDKVEEKFINNERKQAKKEAVHYLISP